MELRRAFLILWVLLIFRAITIILVASMRKILIEIQTRTVVRVLAEIGIFIVVVFLIWQAWGALFIVIGSMILALALNKPVSLMAQRLPGKKRGLATSIAFIIFLVVIGSFVYVAVPPIVNQTSVFIQNLPDYIESLQDRGGLVSDFITRYGLQDQVNQLVSGLQEQAGSIAQGAATSVVGGISSFFNGFVTIITVLILTFLMLIEGPVWIERFWNLYTNDETLARHQHLAAKMYGVVSGYVNGQVVVAAIAGGIGLAVLLVAVSLFDLSVSAVVPLAGLIFITDLIPLIGATLGAVLVTFVLLFTDPMAALAFFIYYIIYQQVENNFIQPVVQARTVALSALSVLVALVIGMSLLGFIGGILAIPIAGCIRVLLEDYMENRKHKAKVTKRDQLVEMAAKEV